MRHCTFLPTRAEADVAIAAAERVSTGLAQLRVDFYLTGEGLRVGELTPYNRGGRALWNPPEWDARLGALWAAAEDARHAA